MNNISDAGESASPASVCLADLARRKTSPQDGADHPEETRANEPLAP
jgi:hypothetical protein